MTSHDDVMCRSSRKCYVVEQRQGSHACGEIKSLCSEFTSLLSSLNVSDYGLTA